MKLAILALASLTFGVLPGVAQAEGPCDHLGALVDPTREPAMAAPKEPAALAAMRDAALRHQDALKLAGVVATRADADAEFAAAVAGYQRAASLSRAPSIRFNLAQLYRQTGAYDLAIEQYGLFLDEGKPRPATRRFAECLRDLAIGERDKAAAEAAAAAARVVPPVLTSAPPVAATEPTAPAPAAPTPGPARSASLSPAPRWYADRLGWGLAGGGVLFAGVGAYLFMDAGRLEDDADGNVDQVARQELRDDASRRRTWGTVATGAGAALVVVGAVRLALTPERPADTRTSWYVTSRSIGVIGWF